MVTQSTSKRKGDAGEAEICEVISSRLGLRLRPGNQKPGAWYEPDVVGVPGRWVEVKREEKPRFGRWVREIIAHLIAAKSNALPLVCWRKNRSRWWAVELLDDWLTREALVASLLRENEELRRAQGLPARPVVVAPGPRQRTLDEALMENETT